MTSVSAGHFQCNSNLHRFDDCNDACWPEATDGGEHGDGKVVVWRPTVHQGDTGRHLHGVNLAGRDPRVSSSGGHVGLTLRRQRDVISKTELLGRHENAGAKKTSSPQPSLRRLLALEQRQKGEKVSFPFFDSSLSDLFG